MKTLHKLSLLGFCLLSCLALSCPLDAMPGAETRGPVFAWYNVQNLFDAQDDGTEYAEYDPGKGSWTQADTDAKLRAIARVVGAMVEGGPDLLALGEIENANVLRQLVNGHLSGMGYRTGILIPVPNSAVNIAVVTRLPILRVQNHEPPSQRGHTGRNMLELEVLAGSSPVTIFVCHWKSKLPDAASTEETRIREAARLNARIAELLAQDPAKAIIVLGDLNESPDEQERVNRAYATALSVTTELPAVATAGLWITGSRELMDAWLTRNPAGTPSAGQASGSPAAAPARRIPLMYSPWLSATPPPGGSYNHRGSWEQIDQVLLSPALRLRSFALPLQPWLYTATGRPREWNRQARDGFSDHLPLVVELDLP